MEAPAHLTWDSRHEALAAAAAHALIDSVRPENLTQVTLLGVWLRRSVEPQAVH